MATTNPEEISEEELAAVLKQLDADAAAIKQRQDEDPKIQQENLLRQEAALAREISMRRVNEERRLKAAWMLDNWGERDFLKALGEDFDKSNYLDILNSRAQYKLDKRENATNPNNPKPANMRKLAKEKGDKKKLEQENKKKWKDRIDQQRTKIAARKNAEYPKEVGETEKKYKAVIAKVHKNRITFIFGQMPYTFSREEISCNLELQVGDWIQFKRTDGITDMKQRLEAIGEIERITGRTPWDLLGRGQKEPRESLYGFVSVVRRNMDDYPDIVKRTPAGSYAPTLPWRIWTPELGNCNDPKNLMEKADEGFLYEALVRIELESSGDFLDNPFIYCEMFQLRKKCHADRQRWALIAPWCLEKLELDTYGANLSRNNIERLNPNMGNREKFPPRVGIVITMSFVSAQRTDVFGYIWNEDSGLMPMKIYTKETGEMMLGKFWTFKTKIVTNEEGTLTVCADGFTATHLYPYGIQVIPPSDISKNNYSAEINVEIQIPADVNGDEIINIDNYIKYIGNVKLDKSLLRSILNGWGVNLEDVAGKTIPMWITFESGYKWEVARIEESAMNKILKELQAQ